MRRKRVYRSLGGRAIIDHVIVSVSFGEQTFDFCGIEGDHITKQLQTGRFYELGLLSAIKLLNIRGVYIDVGAHIGTHSVFFARACGADKVYAFEPHDISFKALLENAEHLGDKRIIPFRMAIHDSWRFVDIEERDHANLGMSRASKGKLVAARALDIFCAENSVEPAFIKIDVEGVEMAVLKSAERTIRDFLPTMAIESATEKELEAVECFLYPMGYTHSEALCRTPTYLWRPRAL